MNVNQPEEFDALSLNPELQAQAEPGENFAAAPSGPVPEWYPENEDEWYEPDYSRGN